MKWYHALMLGLLFGLHSRGISQDWLKTCGLVVAFVWTLAAIGMWGYEKYQEWRERDDA